MSLLPKPTPIGLGNQFAGTLSVQSSLRGTLSIAEEFEIRITTFARTTCSDWSKAIVLGSLNRIDLITFRTPSKTTWLPTGVHVIDYHTIAGTNTTDLYICDNFDDTSGANLLAAGSRDVCFRELFFVVREVWIRRLEPVAKARPTREIFE